VVAYLGAADGSKNAAAQLPPASSDRRLHPTVATKGHTRTTTVGNQGPARDTLVQQREAAEVAIANVRIEKAKVDGDRKVVEADLGPVRYLATLIGTTDEVAMRYFILVVALLLDPAAVLLLLAAI